MKSKPKIQKLYSYFSQVCLEYSVIQKENISRREKNVQLFINLEQQWSLAKGTGFTLKQSFQSPNLSIRRKEFRELNQNTE